MKPTNILNLDNIKKELDDEEIYEDEEGNKLQTIYLGSILSLTPSGKIYTPWVNSNVDLCPKCKGKGETPNPHYKKKTTRRLEADTINLATSIMETYGHYWDAPEKLRKKLDKLRKQAKHWARYVPCDHCDGLGSMEARMDQDWWEELERELDTIGAWSHGSEGDGCDVMISRNVEE